MSQVLVFGSINMDLVVETRAFPRLGAGEFLLKKAPKVSP